MNAAPDVIPDGAIELIDPVVSEVRPSKTLCFPIYLSDADKTTQAGAMLQTVFRKLGDKVLNEWAQSGRRNLNVDVTIKLEETD